MCFSQVGASEGEMFQERAWVRLESWISSLADGKAWIPPSLSAQECLVANCPTYLLGIRGQKRLCTVQCCHQLGQEHPGSHVGNVVMPVVFPVDLRCS